MLSEDAIEKLVQPITQNQEAINTYVLKKIANGVREIGKLSPSDINRMKLLVEYGADIRLMNAELARLANRQIRDIKSMIKTVAIDTHLDAKPLYDYRHKSYVPYDKNEKLKQLVQIVGNRTSETYQNLSNSRATGFLIRDLKNPQALIFQSIGDTYRTVMDEAIQSVITGGVDYRTAMRRVLKQLSDSGIRRMYWDSGYTQRLDTTVRRNLLEGVRAVQQGVQDLIGKEINADGKELSVHINCALDHEPFQGHQFTNKEFDNLQSNQDFEDLNGQKFNAVARAIGMWNCRHIARSIIVGVTKPLHTPEELQQYIDDNHKGYVLPDGRKITMYECTQLQRQMETKIRYAKDEQIALMESGDIEAAKIVQQKVARLTQEYKKFSKDCGLTIHRERASVPEYKWLR